MPFLQLDGFAKVAAACVGFAPAADVSVSNSLPWLPYAGACLGAPGLQAEIDEQGSRAGRGSSADWKPGDGTEIDLRAANDMRVHFPWDRLRLRSFLVHADYWAPLGQTATLPHFPVAMSA
jgi:hypothetical protein